MSRNNNMQELSSEQRLHSRNIVMDHGCAYIRISDVIVGIFVADSEEAGKFLTT